MRLGPWLLSPVILPFALVLGGDAGQGYQRPILGGDTRITAAPVALDPAHPQRTRLGPLRYLGGWVLTGSDRRFGGMRGNGLEHDRDGGQHGDT